MDPAELKNIAEKQFGYFTAAQAVKCGYKKNLHRQFWIKAEWLKVDWGLFRLPGYTDLHESDAARWCLWSRNRHGAIQAVLSHASALYFYGLSEQRPDKMHLTVPHGFRKKIPMGCVIHKSDLPDHEIIDHGAYLVTTPMRTLQDMHDELMAIGQYNAVMEKAIRRGLASGSRVVQKGAVMAGNGFADNGLEFAGDESGLRSMAAVSAGGLSPSAITAEVLANNPPVYGKWGLPHNFKWRGSNAAFTLVELLVVISIISVLAGLLLPALNTAIQTARRMSCLSAQKQVFLAAGMYANDEAGFLVPWGVVAGGTVHIGNPNHYKRNGIPWIQYPKSADPQGGPAGLGLLYDMGYIKDGHIFYCPSDKRRNYGNVHYAISIPHPFSECWGKDTRYVYISYWYRCHLKTSTMKSGVPSPCRISRDPPGAAIISDNFYGEDCYADGGSFGSSFPECHRTGVNTVFLDGHGTFHVDDGTLRSTVTTQIDDVHLGWEALDGIMVGTPW